MTSTNDPLSADCRLGYCMQRLIIEHGVRARVMEAVPGCYSPKSRAVVLLPPASFTARDLTQALGRLGDWVPKSDVCRAKKMPAQLRYLFKNKKVLFHLCGTEEQYLMQNFFYQNQPLRGYLEKFLNPFDFSIKPKGMVWNRAGKGNRDILLTTDPEVIQKFLGVTETGIDDRFASLEEFVTYLMDLRLISCKERGKCRNAMLTAGGDPTKLQLPSYGLINKDKFLQLVCTHFPKFKKSSQGCRQKG